MESQIQTECAGERRVHLDYWLPTQTAPFITSLKCLSGLCLLIDRGLRYFG
jgi:hypothetical protein